MTPPQKRPTTLELTRVAVRLRPEQVAAIVTHLQRDAVDRGDPKAHELLRMVNTWLNDVSAAAISADRASRRRTCDHCTRAVPIAGEVAALVARVRQKERR